MSKAINEILEEDKSIKIINHYREYLDSPEMRLYEKYPSFVGGGSPYVKDKPSQQNNNLCNCNSGLKFKKCCKNKTKENKQ